MTHATIARVSLGVLVVAAGAGCGQGKLANPFADRGSAKDGARFTILLFSNDGPGHAAQAELYRQRTAQHAGWRDLRVVHHATHSELWWGGYATIEAAQDNLKKAKAYVTPARVPVYAKALVIPLPVEDVGPPPWRLSGIRGEWTVVVASFYDVPEANYFGRKENAVEYCKQLRSEGREAYYHHGPARSNVTVGSFPASAARLPPSGQGEPKVLDWRLGRTMKDFEFLAVNGRKEYVSRLVDAGDGRGKIQRDARKSFLLRIPHAKE